MKHVAHRIDKNTVEYRGHEITKYPHLKGFHGHYQAGRKKSFALYSQAKTYIDLVEDRKLEEAKYLLLKEERKTNGHSQDLLDRENANYEAMRTIDMKLSVIP